MEWVETTGRTIQEAKEAALDQLGVDEHDAEFQILEEPRLGLFGRVRAEGRVRARVRPSTPRAKQDRRDRRRKGQGASGGTADQAEGDHDDARPTASRTSAPSVGGHRASSSDDATPARRGPAADERPRAHLDDRHDDGAHPGREGDMLMDVALQEQAEVARQFLVGLLSRFGLAARLDIDILEEDERLEVRIEGDNLGVLIGQKGSTLAALQELTRTHVMHRTAARNGRIHVDVSGYRHRRAEALAAFAQGLAKDVQRSGRAVALEPMNAADRKVVHDAVAKIEGVATRSEGDDERRHVVLVPLAADSPSAGPDAPAPTHSTDDLGTRATDEGDPDSGAGLDAV